MYCIIQLKTLYLISFFFSPEMKIKMKIKRIFLNIKTPKFLVLFTKCVSICYISIYIKMTLLRVLINRIAV